MYQNSAAVAPLVEGWPTDPIQLIFGSVFREFGALPTGMVLATSYGKVEWLGVHVLLVQSAVNVGDSAVLGAGAAFWRLVQIYENPGTRPQLDRETGSYECYQVGKVWVGESAERDMRG